MKKLLSISILSLCVVAFTVDDPSDFIKKISSRFLLKMATYPQEKVYLQTDKPHYVAGEKVWLRAYLVNAITHVPSEESRYVYVELTDRRDSVLQRVKIARRKEAFEGYLGLSPDLLQDDYMIRAYSYAMQSVGEDYLFKKQIRVVNPRRPALPRDTGEPVGTPSGKQPKTAIDPKSERDLDVAFFPEGGELLSGNLQLTAFKAVNRYGMPEEISGVIENDSGDTVVYFASRHDGMGRLRLPVEAGVRYKARVRTEDGLEKVFALPEVNAKGVGIRLLRNDTVVRYAVVKSRDAVMPPDLYVMIHTRGLVYAVLPVSDFPVGELAVRDMLEGIAHIVLFDSRCRIWSQRLCFVKRPDKPQLLLATDRKGYERRDSVGLELGFGKSGRSRLEGAFSVSVVSDRMVNVSLSHTHILTDLLLTSDLKGYIESPDYYFDDANPMAAADLDLVMLTHGWTRFEVEKEMKGEVEPVAFYVEKGQTVSGHVKNFNGKKASLAQLLILSTAGHVQMTEADSSGKFLLEGIEYYDSTAFVVQAIRHNGKRSVEVIGDRDTFLSVSNFFPWRPAAREEMAGFLGRYGQAYYYENGQKVYLLEEAIVRRKYEPRYYSPVERQSHASLDSSAIAGMKELGIRQIIERLRGLQVEDRSVTLMGKDTLAIFINELPVMDFSEVEMLQPEQILRISYIGRNDAFIFYGDRVDEYLGQKLSRSGGVLYITVDPAYRAARRDHPSLVRFYPLGIQRPAAFYSPKYDRSPGPGSESEPDERSTIYWNPDVRLSRDSTARLSFYTADRYDTYTITVEGVTSGGEVLRKQIKMKVEGDSSR